MLTVPYLPETDLTPALAHLLGQMRACTLCAAALPLGPRPIMRLHQQARIVIASQAPGRLAHLSGIPFDDPSGKRLRAWLGLSEAQFYDATKLAILPMGFCYPGTGPTGDFAPRPECAPTWHPSALAQLHPDALLVVVGAFALKRHLPANPHNSLGETVRDYASFLPRAFPLPHPSPRNRAVLTWPWFAAEVLPALQREVQARLAG